MFVGVTTQHDLQFYELRSIIFYYDHVLNLHHHIINNSTTNIMMQMSVYYNFLLISLVPLASARANRGVDVNGASIDFLGQSGKMKFCPTAQCEQTSMTISMNKLVELDQAAQQTNNKVPSFASQAFGTLIKNYTTTTPSGHFP